jgi:hypothetical protein
MKTSILFALTLLALHSSAQAQDQTMEQHEFSGRISISLVFDGSNARYTRMYSTESTLLVTPWSKENDKVVVIFDVTGGKRGCVGSETTYVGYQTAFNTYDLYLKDGSNTPTPTNAVAVGMLVVTKSEAHLHLTNGFESTTTNMNGKCIYSLPADSLITLPILNN